MPYPVANTAAPNTIGQPQRSAATTSQGGYLAQGVHAGENFQLLGPRRLPTEDFVPRVSQPFFVLDSGMENGALVGVP